MTGSFILNNGIALPAAAFGTYKAVDGNVNTILNAIKAGYRYFDTASFYGTGRIRCKSHSGKRNCTK